MKSYHKLNDSYFEVDSAKDVLDFIGLKIITAIICVLAWIAGFAVGAFCIYYLLEHPDRVLLFLADALDCLVYNDV